MITTPSDLLAYLSAVALTHPGVKQVVTGEDVRFEQKTLSGAMYPQIDIEAPRAILPIGQDPVTISTMVWVKVHTPGGNNADEDINLDLAFRIASDFVSTLRAHDYDNFFGLSLVDPSIRINPVFANTSDNLRGYVFEVNVSVNDPAPCNNSIDPAAVFVPIFSWVNATAGDPTALTVNLTNKSINAAGAALTWYYSEPITQATPVVAVDPFNDPIEIAPVPGQVNREVCLWLKMVKGGVTLWSFARIDSRASSGRSVPFMSKLPE